MINLVEARQLQVGDILHDLFGNRWKVTGAVKTWKTDPSRIRVPLKHGLRNYDAITDADFDGNGVCSTLTKGEPPLPKEKMRHLKGRAYVMRDGKPVDPYNGEELSL